MRRRKELDASHQELEVQKKYLEEIREEQELARNRAEDEIRQVREIDITIEFMFAGINMFWAGLRLILARAARRGLK